MSTSVPLSMSDDRKSLLSRSSSLALRSESVDLLLAPTTHGDILPGTLALEDVTVLTGELRISRASSINGPWGFRATNMRIGFAVEFLVVLGNLDMENSLFLMMTPPG